MRGMFAYTNFAYVDISGWNVSSVTVFEDMFLNANALSRDNQCSIHTSWSSNANWAYDWESTCFVLPEELFSTAQLVADGESDVRDIAVGDLNGDGKLDVITSSMGGGTFGWYPNNGTGFDARVQLGSGTYNHPNDVKAVDMDGDGDLDVASLLNSLPLKLYLMTHQQKVLPGVS